jgi:isoaspartyl peptidase/L-asparaginase-like protein (Ntn-hydrolase superfamily)
VFSADGRNELDAALMDGDKRRSGAIAKPLAGRPRLVATAA